VSYELNPDIFCQKAFFLVVTEEKKKYILIAGVAEANALRFSTEGGKSGLQRAVRLLTGGRGDPTESATESRPPMACKGTGKGETVG